MYSQSQKGFIHTSVVKFVSIFLISMSSLTLQAEIFTVDTTSGANAFSDIQCYQNEISPAGAALTLADATSNDDGFLSLREAICLANHNNQADTIVLSNATYTLTEIDNYWYGANGLPPIASDISIVGNGAVIERDSSSSLNFRLFFISRKVLTDALGDGMLTLQDVTLRNGYAKGGDSRDGGGGAGMGGAIFNQGQLNISRISLHNNQVQGGSTDISTLRDGGGGIYRNATSSNGGGFGVGPISGGFAGSNGHINGGGGGFGLDHATGRIGGGSGTTGGDSDSLVGSGRDGGGGNFGDNGGNFGKGGRGSRGGGGGIGGGGGTSSSSSGGGGGFGGGGGYKGGDGGFGAGGGGGFGGTGNSSDSGNGGTRGFGGGIGGNGGSFLSGIGGGGAGLGAAIFNHTGTLNATNCTLTNNTAKGGNGAAGSFGGTGGSGIGGAIFNLDGAVSLNHCTLANNTVAGGSGRTNGSAQGGAIYNRIQDPQVSNRFNGGTIRLTATILSGSIGSTDCRHSKRSGVTLSSDVISNSYNFVESVTNCTFTNTGDAINMDPMVAALADNGGLTPTMALQSGSLAINRGDPADSVFIDQRSLFVNNIRDIGSFESNGFTYDCPSPIDTQGFTTTVSNPAKLIQAIECANVNGHSQADTIILVADITLSSEYENSSTFGKTGTPAITTKLNLNGNGFILQRESTITSAFRLLRASRVADVLIDNIRLLNGKVSGINFVGQGGAILNQGSMHIENSIITENSATSGGGLSFYDDTYSRNITINNSLLKRNSATGYGNDIVVNIGRISSITNSVFTDNLIPSKSSIYLFNANLDTLKNTTFSNNGGTAIFVSYSTIANVENNTFVGNSTAIKSFINGTIVGDVTTLTNNVFKNTTVCDTITVSNASNNLTDAITTCDGTTVGSLGTISNMSLSLLDNNCVTPLAGGTCLPTYALLPGSNAINAATGTPPNKDSRGFIAEGVRDIGAFEARIPVVIAPPDISPTEATGATTAVSLGVASVTDADEPGLTVSADTSSPFAVGVYTVTWSATDSQGFVGTDIQTVNVTDSTDPIVTAPANITVEATGATTAVALGTATATDLVDGTLTATADMASPFAVGVHTVTWSVTDTAGNTGLASQTVTITDTTAPILTLLGSPTVLLRVGDSYSDAGATANDIAEGDLTTSIMTANPVDTSIVGNFTITYDVSDSVPNATVQVTRLVKVQATIGGTISGIESTNTITLDDGNESLTLGNGVYTFTSGYDTGSNYSVSLTQPTGTPSQVCSISNDQGQINTSNITNIQITCTTNTYFIGVMLTGLNPVNNVTIDINGTEQLQLNNNGAFAFVNPLTDESAYTITVAIEPSSPNQTCSITNETGVLAGQDISDIAINCLDNLYFVGGTVIGLGIEYGLIIKNNNTDDQIINANGAFVFATPLVDLENYDASYQIQPNSTNRACVIRRNSGTIAGDDIANILITCDFDNDLIYINGFEGE